MNDLERSLRDLIKKVFTAKKGNDWIKELSEQDVFFKERFNELTEMMNKEQRLWCLGCSTDILEYSYPGTLKEFIHHKWEWFQHSVGDSKKDFGEWMDSIAKIRTPVKHNRTPELISPEDLEKAKRACEKLLDIISKKS